MMSIRMTQAAVVTALSAGLLAVASSSLAGQTRFQPPDTTPDYSRYRTVEECIVATTRTSETARRSLPIWRDTAEYLRREELDSLPSEAIDVARRCSTPFHPDSVQVKDYNNWIKLYLMANRDDAADIVMRRRVASVRQDTSKREELYTTLITAMTTYGSARPARWKNVQAIGTMAEEKGGASGPRELLRVYEIQFSLGYAVNDTAVTRRMAEKMIAVVKGMTPAQKDERWYLRFGRYGVAGALDYLAALALMDSLRRSGDAYVALRRANWEQARGNNTDPLPSYVGRRAAPLVADFWFTPPGAVGQGGPGAGAAPPVAAAAAGTHSQSQSRPTAGKVSLVIFLRSGCHENAPIFVGPLVRQTHRVSCWDLYAMTRRLAQRFPDLEMTLVSQTTGYIADGALLTPEAETQFLQKWWHGFHRVPATLAVTNTRFFRLQDVDRRRIDEPVENNVAYRFSDGEEMGSKMMYLIDTNGTILFSGGAYREAERPLRQMLDAVMSRTR